MYLYVILSKKKNMSLCLYVEKPVIVLMCLDVILSKIFVIMLMCLHVFMSFCRKTLLLC